MRTSVSGIWSVTNPSGLEINIGERLTVGVAHDKAGYLFLDGPRRRGQNTANMNYDFTAALPPGVIESQPLVWPNLASSSHPCALA